jgi:glucosamine--fructose-6-phosphate aminotransferase (isomerizing)
VACQTRVAALDFLLPALARLEYRGYDSAGVSVQTRSGQVVRLRSVGRLAALGECVAAVHGPTLDGVGIGHTRWATHGLVSEANSHPHVDCTGKVHVVHNGIIENADDLREELRGRGHAFATDVDSEVVAHLVEERLGPDTDLAHAVSGAVAELRGSWALAVLCEGVRAVVVTAHHSPLLVGHGEGGAFAASDVTAFSGWTDDVRVVEDRQVVVLRESGLEGLEPGSCGVGPIAVATPAAPTDIGPGLFPDHMAKEIAEQPRAVAGVVDRLAGGISDAVTWRQLGLPELTGVRFVACGTSLNAAAVLARLLARWGVPSVLTPASELDGTAPGAGFLDIALSQSGETADVLRALENRQAPLLVLTNAPHSTLARGADAVVELGTGPEIGVAATKTFSAQVAVGACVLLSALVSSGRLPILPARSLADRLRDLPEELANAHDLASQVCPEVAAGLAEAPGFLFLGRGAAVPYAAEGALKLKELTYRWADHQPAGELKHGPIALVDTGTPVVVVDDGNAKLRANVAEVEARGARVLDVGGAGSVLPYRRGDAEAVPWGPLPAVVALQHLAREVALRLGRDVDKPRNLAKSVTVE